MAGMNITTFNLDMMAYSIALNRYFFNTQRMVQEYVLNAYLN
jgi:starch phosphorylase